MDVESIQGSTDQDPCYTDGSELGRWLCHQWAAAAVPSSEQRGGRRELQNPDYADNRGKPAEVNISNLFLDEQNPRLSSHHASTQEQILDVLAREMSIDEIAFSIAANGYYATERLLVIACDAGPPKTYTVIEGNRRLAAVRLLLDRKAQRRTKTTDLPQIDRSLRQQLRVLPVSIFENRRQLWPYLGFRHVNGPREWDGFAKAEYVATVHEQYGVPVEEISYRIGDRFSTVKRMYLGYRLIRQAENAAVFDRKDRFNEKRFYFSHLYTAADQTPFRAFLGISEKRVDRTRPVPTKSLKKLGELLLWIYGSRSQGKAPLVQRQNPDLNFLRQAIGDKDAVAAIRQGGGLRRASEIARGDDVVFRELIVSAKEGLQEVSKFVTLGYQGERDLLKTAEDIQRLADDLCDRMTDIEHQTSGDGRRRARSRRSM